MVRGSAATALRLAPISLQGRAPGEASSYQSCVMRSRKAGTHAPATVMQCVRGLIGQDGETRCAGYSAVVPFSHFPRLPGRRHDAVPGGLLNKPRSHGFHWCRALFGSDGVAERCRCRVVGHLPCRGHQLRPMSVAPSRTMLVSRRQPSRGRRCASSPFDRRGRPTVLPQPSSCFTRVRMTWVIQ